MTRQGFEAIAKSKDTQIIIKQHFRFVADGFEDDFEEEFIQKSKVKEALTKDRTTENWKGCPVQQVLFEIKKELGL